MAQPPNISFLFPFVSCPGGVARHQGLCVKTLKGVAVPAGSSHSGLVSTAAPNHLVLVEKSHHMAGTDPQWQSLAIGFGHADATWQHAAQATRRTQCLGGRDALAAA